MRLRFSRTADYGLRAALEVARAPTGDLVTRRAIADATDAPMATSGAEHAAEASDAETAAEAGIDASEPEAERVARGPRAAIAA